MRKALAALSLLGSFSCQVESAPPPEVEADESDQAIVNGTVDDGHPSTVALTVGHTAFCSGTLVTPTVVVAAAHCIHPDIGVSPPDQIEVFFGTSTSQGGQYIQVTEGEYQSLWSLNSPQGDNDISVLRLAEPAPVAPTPIGDLPPVGSQITLVGFGITQGGGQDAGTKRVTTGTIAEVYPRQFVMYFADGNDSGTCNGDSGGTALYNDGTGDKLVGIHTLSDCQNAMVDERVDVHLADFVQPFIDATPTCEQDGGCANGCAAPDPDCPCAADGFCTAACPTAGADPDCDPACGANAICATNCALPDPDCKPKCTQNGTCEAGCGAADPDCPTASTSQTSTGSGHFVGNGGSGGGDAADDGDSGSGCGCRVDTEAPRGAWALLAVSLAGAVARRRRRRGASGGGRRHV